MAQHKGILLDGEYGLVVSPRRDGNGKITGGMLVGDTLMQETAIVLKLRPGDLKEDPKVGVGLTKYIRSAVNPAKVEIDIKQHLTRVGIDWEEVKDQLTITN